jgi:hypothetical protein
LGSNLWDTVAAFFEANILKVTAPEVALGSYPIFVSTVRVTQGRDNSSCFEVGLELPQGSDEDVVEGRGKLQHKLPII